MEFMSKDFMSMDFDLAENVLYFLNSELNSMKFVLDWDTKDKFYYNILNKSLADVLVIPNDHSMVLAIPEVTKYFHPKIPAFNIKYIEDCFKIKDFPDPTKYLISHTSSANYTKEQLVDCLGHQTKSWSDLQSIPKNKNNSSDDDSVDFMATNSLTSSFNTKNTRMPYSHNEEISIVKYIIKNNYAFDVTGVKMWKNMERENVCKLRTWQSMKQRYLRHIRYNLNSGNYSYPFLSSNDLKKLRQGLSIDKCDKIAIKSSINEARINNWQSSDSS